MRLLFIFALCVSTAMAQLQWVPYNVHHPLIRRRIFRIIFHPDGQRWYRIIVPRPIIYPNRFSEYSGSGYRNPFITSYHNQNGYQYSSQYDSRFPNVPEYRNQYLSMQKDQLDSPTRNSYLSTNRDKYIPYQSQNISPFRRQYPYGQYWNADQNQYQSSNQNHIWSPFRNSYVHSYPAHNIWRPYHNQYQVFPNQFLGQYPNQFPVQYFRPNNLYFNSYRVPQNTYQSSYYVSPYGNQYMNGFLNRYLTYENPYPVGRRWWRAYRSPVYRYQIPVNRDLSTGYAA